MSGEQIWKTRRLYCVVKELLVSDCKNNNNCRDRAIYSFRAVRNKRLYDNV